MVMQISESTVSEQIVRVDVAEASETKEEAIKTRARKTP
jgi:hypothetical protein